MRTRLFPTSYPQCRRLLVYSRLSMRLIPSLTVHLLPPLQAGDKVLQKAFQRLWVDFRRCRASYGAQLEKPLETNLVFHITYYSHTLKRELFGCRDFICHMLKVFHVAANKFINLRGLLLDPPEFEVLKSFIFTHITNFEDVSCSWPLASLYSI